MRTWPGKGTSHTLIKGGSAQTQYLFIHVCVSRDIPHELRGGEGILNNG